MSWMLAATAAATALGAYRAKKQSDRAQDIEADSRKQRAAQIKYSPWTGRENFSNIQYAGGDQTADMIGGGLQGGMTGAAFAQGLGAGKAAETAASSAGTQSYLGGNKMSADLGKSAFNSSTMPAAGGMGAGMGAGAAPMGGASGGYLGGGQPLTDPNNPFMQQQAPSLYGASPWPRMAGR